VGAQDEQERIRLSAEIKIHPEAYMNDQNPSMDFNPGPAPAKKNNRTLIIVIVVVIVLCCCIVGGAGAVWLWYNGDKLLQQGTSALVQML